MIPSRSTGSLLLTAHGRRSHAVNGHEARRPSANVLRSDDGGVGGFQCPRDEHAVVAACLHPVGAVTAAFRLGVKLLCYRTDVP